MVEEAQKLLHFYRLLPIELPALLIIDPVTGGSISDPMIRLWVDQ